MYIFVHTFILNNYNFLVKYYFYELNDMSRPYSQQKKFHYTYCITELNSRRKYIGVRSSDIDPLMDIGVNYFSSSSNKEFIDNQKYNHNNYESRYKW